MWLTVSDIAMAKINSRVCLKKILGKMEWKVKELFSKLSEFLVSNFK